MRKDFKLEATGTLWQLTLWSNKDCQDFWQSLVVFVEDFESVYSRFKKDSLVARLSGVTGGFDVPEDFIKMLRIYKKIYFATSGAFTPLGGKTISDLGYDTKYSLQKKSEIEIAPDMHECIEELSQEKIRIKQPVYFDFGALGKGYLADLILDQVKKNPDITRVVINAGGDILHWNSGSEKLRIAMQSPTDETKAIGVYELANGALASSASNKRKWDGAHHIYDATSGQSASAVQSVWVATDALAFADACATAAFLADPESLSEIYAIDYAMILEDNTLLYSKSFNFSST